MHPRSNASASSKTIEESGDGSLILAIIEQSWHQGKVDEELLRRWLEEIGELRSSSNALPKGNACVSISRGFSCAGIGQISPSANRSTKVDEARSRKDTLEANPKLKRSPQRIKSETGLTEDLWRAIFSRLPMDGLPYASAVCRQWRDIIRDPELWAAAFVTHWKLSSISGIPSATAFWRGKLSQFAISHVLTGEETVASLAVKYNVQVMEIRRMNNMMSDHGIYSRKRLLIPITDATFLGGRHCFIETDMAAKREVAVLYLDGAQPDAHSSSSSLSRSRKQAAQKLQARVMDSLKRSLGCDDGTASYYLSLCEGNVREAFSEFMEDIRWEQRQCLVVRSA